MKKVLLLIFACCFSVLTANAQRFALIDMEYILQNIPSYENANKKLENASKQWQTEIEKISNEAKSMYESYQSKSGSLTDAAKKQQEDAIVAKEKSAAELRRKYFGPEGELSKMQEELIKPIEDDIYEAVKAIAQQKGYAAVIDRASANSLIFASPSIDISNDVLTKLGVAKN